MDNLRFKVLPGGFCEEKLDCVPCFIKNRLILLRHLQRKSTFFNFPNKKATRYILCHIWMLFEQNKSYIDLQSLTSYGA